MHDADGEHYHDDGTFAASHDDTVTWTTVGLDVGSSTTQMILSRISLVREDAYYVVAERRTIHESEILLTPYRSERAIDGARLSAFLEREFSAAGIDRDEVDTGAVILTGLALTAMNARAIADAVADESGKFVAVSAGDLLEARLAASGAGLPGLSAARAGVVLHIDVGGGTTKLSAWQQGKPLGVAALDVGARLLTLEQGRIERVRSPVRRAAADLRLDLEPGARLDAKMAARLASALAQSVLAYAGLREGVRLPALLRTKPLFAAAPPPIEAVIFSGGVSEYIYGRERRSFGDLGPWLGEAIRTEVAECGVEVLPFERGIRATVLGASQHSGQLSGNTIFVSDPLQLPLRNIPVLVPQIDLSGDGLDRDEIARALHEALALHERSAVSRSPALAIRWAGTPSFARLSALANAITDSLESRLGEGDPCIVLVEGDVAAVLGRKLERALEKRRPVICLDGVHVHEFDHLDIGAVTARTRAVPVVVKSLLFAGHARSEHHHV